MKYFKWKKNIHFDFNRELLELERKCTEKMRETNKVPLTTTSWCNYLRMSSFFPLIFSFPFVFIFIIDQSIIVDLVQVIFFFLYIYVFHYYREQINMYTKSIDFHKKRRKKIKCPSWLYRMFSHKICILWLNVFISRIKEKNEHGHVSL